jgi:hypothetical protein
LPNNLVFILVFMQLCALVDREKKSELLSPINQSMALLTYLIWNFMQMGWLGKKPRLPLNIHMAAVIIMYSPSSHWTSFCKGLGLCQCQPQKAVPSLSLSLSLNAVHTTNLHVLGQWTKKVHNSKQSFMWVARHVRIQVNTKLSAFFFPFPHHPIQNHSKTRKRNKDIYHTITHQSFFFSFFFIFFGIEILVKFNKTLSPIIWVRTMIYHPSNGDNLSHKLTILEHNLSSTQWTYRLQNHQI